MQVSDRAMATIREIVLRALQGRDADVYLFGSRARGDATDLSDFDVAIWPHGDLPPSVLSDLREALEESTVPYRVDVVDLREASVELRRRARAEGIRWK